MRIGRGFFSSGSSRCSSIVSRPLESLAARHADVVGQLEAALEVAPADAAIEVLGSVVAVGVGPCR